MRAQFPSLEGTKIWQEYKRKDREMKKKRVLAGSEDEDEEDEEIEVDPREVADEILAEGLGSVVAIHGGNGRPYIAKELIEMNFGLSARDAKKVKMLLEQQVDDLSEFKEA
jgi:hypothetical protein